MHQTDAPDSGNARYSKPAPPTAPAVALFVIGLTAIKLAVALNTDLVLDEAYYTLWSLHPLQAGYFDHPPAVAWFIKAGQLVLGETELASRLVAILSTLVISLAVYRTSNLLFDSAAIAAFSVFWFNVSPGAAGGLLVITPDAPSMLFWTLAIWSAAELHRSGRPNWWFAFGLFAGLGLNAKYTGLFLGAGIVLWLLLYPQARRWFGVWQLYAGGALALALFAPVLYWNAANGMASLAFQLGRSAQGFPEGVAGLLHLPEFIGSQIALLWPGLFYFVAAGFALYAGRKRTFPDPAVGLLVATALPALLYFTFHGLHSRVQGNWTLPLYGQLAILGAWAAVVWTPANVALSAFGRFLRRWQTPLGFAFVLVIYAHAVFRPFAIPIEEPTSEMHGWEDAVSAVSAEARKSGAGTLFAIDYGMMGWLASYARFGGHDLVVLPARESYRYGYMGLPGNAAISWPALIVLRSTLKSPPQEGSGTEIGLEGHFMVSVVRRGPHGEGIDRLDLYRTEAPGEELYPR